MKRFFFLLLLFSFTACGAQEGVPFKSAKVKATVEWIKNDTAQISTADYGVKYLIDSKDLEIEQEYWFGLVKIAEDRSRTRRATVSWFHISPEQAEKNVKVLLARSNF